MQTVLIVIHLMIVIAMIAVILVQRSEGGALGIGGGGGGGMFTARGSANLLTRTTTILAVTFFITSLALALIAKQQAEAPSILDGVDAVAPGATTDPSRGTGEGLLDLLREQSGETIPAPPTDDGSAGAIPTAPVEAPGMPQVPTGE